MREGASGVTAYATDSDARVCAFALSGRMFVAGLLTGMARELPVQGAVFDPRPDPGATRVAYVSGASLRIAELDGTSWELAGETTPDVTWGSAEFIAAEEMGRHRGYWWSPDGTMIAACRVDNSPVQQWHIGNPAEPADAPHVVRYPAAGTANAEVTQHVLPLEGNPVEVTWDRASYPYLTNVVWAAADRLLLAVQSRDQRTVMVLAADPQRGATEPVMADGDPAWVELVSGTPAVLADGGVVTCADRDGARRLMVDGQAVTPADLQVRSVVAAAGGTVWFHANPIDDATVQHVWRWDGALQALTTEPGVHSATVGGSTVVLRSAVLHEPGAITSVLGGPAIASLAAIPLVRPNVTLLR